MVESQTFNLPVVGSIPTRRTNFLFIITFYGAVDYWLGPQAFNLLKRVRFPSALPFHSERDMTETHRRTIVRAITWRIIAILLSAPFTGISIALLINFLMTISFYVHERIWLHIPWGKQSA